MTLALLPSDADSWPAFLLASAEAALENTPEAWGTQNAQENP